MLASVERCALETSSLPRPVESRIAAIQAIRAAETENLLSRLRLVRSCLNKEQLEMPVLEFFKENLPNLSVIRNEKYKVFELRWNENNGSLAAIPAIDDLEFSVSSVKKTFLDTVNLKIPDIVLGESSEDYQIAGACNSLRTPGAMSNRLSFGMTPKTQRLPKIGEAILSVHGSPLGVYKEENLAAINESGEGSDAAAC